MAGLKAGRWQQQRDASAKNKVLDLLVQSLTHLKIKVAMNFKMRVRVASLTHVGKSGPLAFAGSRTRLLCVN